MQINLEIPDEIATNNTLGEADWLREFAIALFKKELVTLGRASKIAQMHQLVLINHLWLLKEIYEIDECLGRQEALQLNLPIIGILGILVLAKQKGLISAVKPVMDSLLEEAGFWISIQLYDRILLLSEEQF
jgi:predicted nucleic acid-binding protein